MFKLDHGGRRLKLETGRVLLYMYIFTTNEVNKDFALFEWTRRQIYLTEEGTSSAHQRIFFSKCRQGARSSSGRMLDTQ